MAGDLGNFGPYKCAFRTKNGVSIIKVDKIKKFSFRVPLYPLREGPRYIATTRNEGGCVFERALTCSAAPLCGVKMTKGLAGLRNFFFVALHRLLVFSLIVMPLNKQDLFDIALIVPAARPLVCWSAENLFGCRWSVGAGPSFLFLGEGGTIGELGSGIAKNGSALVI